MKLNYLDSEAVLNAFIKKLNIIGAKHNIKNFKLLMNLMHIYKYEFKTSKEMIDQYIEKKDITSQKEKDTIKTLVIRYNKEMERLNLIKKVYDPKDKRKKIIKITKKGKLICHELLVDNFIEI